MAKPAKLKWQPSCWRCFNVITGPCESGAFIKQNGAAFEMIGCTALRKIVDYKSAEALCPLHPDRRQVDEDGRLILPEG